MRPDPARSGWNASNPIRAVLAAVIVGLLPIGTNLMTPLFPVFQQRMHLGHTEIAAVYVAYVVPVVIGLPLFGHWSDYMGRRIVLLMSLVLSILGAVLLASAATFPALLSGRALHGLAVALSTGAGAAALRDVLPARPALCARITLLASLGGAAIGPFAGGILSDFGDPVRFPYIVYVLTLVLLMIPVAAVRAKLPVLRVSGGRFRQLFLQRLYVSSQSRGIFFLASFVGFLSFAVFGFFLSVAPGYYVSILGESRTVGGLPAVLALGSSALAQLLPIRGGHKAGISLLAMAAGIVLVALAFASPGGPWALFGAAVLIGSSQGIAFRTLFTALSGNLTQETAARTVSLMYAIAFLGSAVPVLGLGFAMDHLDPVFAVNAFLIVAALASISFAGPCLAYRRKAVGRSLA